MKFCFFHSNAHDVNTPCKEYEKSLGEDTKTLSNEVKKCPQCGAITEKIEGCNHMRCAYCNIEWCWLCEKKLYFTGTYPMHYSWWNLFGCNMAYTNNSNNRMFDENSKEALSTRIKLG